MSHIIADMNPLILLNRNFAVQDGSMQLDRTTSDQLDQVYDHDIDSPRLIKLPQLGGTINFRLPRKKTIITVKR